MGWIPRAIEGAGKKSGSTAFSETVTGQDWQGKRWFIQRIPVWVPTAGGGGAIVYVLLRAFHIVP